MCLPVTPGVRHSGQHFGNCLQWLGSGSYYKKQKSKVLQWQLVYINIKWILAKRLQCFSCCFLRHHLPGRSKFLCCKKNKKRY